MMRRSRRTALLALVAPLAVAILALLLWRFRQPQPITLTGVVIRQDPDPGKQVPIADVDIAAANGVAIQGTKSDASGLFHMPLSTGVRPGQLVTLQFKHSDYQPLALTAPAGDRLYIARMTPITPNVHIAPNIPSVNIANVTVTYTLRATTTMSVGSAVRTIEVVNTGNIPCTSQSPCSPDGKWKAAAVSVSFDAGEGNEFQRPRVSCIAGPCAFTKIDSDRLSPDRRMINISVRNWSDTTTFLFQAEVVRSISEDVGRRVFPVIFGKDLNFSLPTEAEGTSIEAEVDGNSVVFPLGPDLCLTWADCHVRIDPDQTRVYRCELKAGYQFR
jgi:hypothetical protein